MKHLQLENINECPLCQNQGFENFIEGEDYLTGFGRFSIVRCLQCSLLFTTPRPNAASSALCYPAVKYQSHNESKKSAFEKLYFFVQALMLHRKLALVNSLVGSSKTVLDVGCGIGKFAGFMAARNYQVAGIEPSQEARTEAQKRGLAVFENIAEYKASQKTKPNAITLWHVLEHQHNYVNSLCEYNEILGLNGWLIVAVPQFGSFDAWFYKEKWAAYDLPRHLFHFNKQTLIKSAQKTGFEIVKTKGMPFDAFYASWLSEINYKSKIGLLRAPLIATVSNALAFMGVRPWSSQIFVFRKKTN